MGTHMICVHIYKYLCTNTNNGSQSLNRWLNDGRQEGVVKDGGNGRDTLVYKTQGEKTVKTQ